MALHRNYKLTSKERETLYGRHSPAGYTYLQSQKPKKLKRVKKTQKPTGYKKIAYYGQGRETADSILRSLKRRKR